MIRCIIIEDQPPAQRLLQKYIGDMENMELKAVFPDALQALDFLKKEPIDLMFLDIHLPKISGIDFLKVLPHRPHVILTTAFTDYALESYEYNVVDYLLKPFSFERFVKAVSKMPERKIERFFEDASTEQYNVRDVVFVKSGFDLIKIAVPDILYIKSKADYTEIFTVEKKYLTTYPLRHWLNTLGGNRFAQIHKSYIVNASKIIRISGNSIFLNKDTMVPIGRAYKEGFIGKYLK